MKRHNVVTGILLMVITLVFVVLNLTSCGDRPPNRYQTSDYQVEVSERIPVDRYVRQDGYIMKVVTFEDHRYLVGESYTHLESCKCKLQ